MSRPRLGPLRRGAETAPEAEADPTVPEPEVERMDRR